jgi:hypothetical protein
MEDIETLNYDDLNAVAKLSSDQHYKDVMSVRTATVHHGTCRVDPARHV